jgi:EAL domain-containing protein (putative c-di-GMP-specific phosphodiesterase class I)
MEAALMAEDRLVTKPVLLSLSQLLEAGPALAGEAAGQIVKLSWDNLVLHSVFHPIYSASHGQAMGVEALVRGCNEGGSAVPPPEMIRRAQMLGVMDEWDQAVRLMHLHNLSLVQTTSKLFLNITPGGTLADGFHPERFAESLRAYGMLPDQVVFELLETSVQDEARLAQAVALYRNLGCAVAIDDFGAGASNFERLWYISPDVIKVDRVLLTHAARVPGGRRLLGELVGLLHEGGAMVVLEGVENPGEVVLALEADADFVQGFAFCRPGALNGTWYDGSAVLQAAGAMLFHRTFQARSWLTPYITAVQRGAAALRRGASFAKVKDQLLEQADAEYAFLLDERGMQLESYPEPLRAMSILSGHGIQTASSTWLRRPYVRQALETPRSVCVTRPYRSFTTGHMCVTLSCAYHSRRGLRILCLDVRWDEAATFDDVAWNEVE